MVKMSGIISFIYHVSKNPHALVTKEGYYRWQCEEYKKENENLKKRIEELEKRIKEMID